jgi:hypothetical protein
VPRNRSLIIFHFGGASKPPKWVGKPGSLH